MMQTKMMNEGELVRLESRLLLKLDDAQRNTDKYVIDKSVYLYSYINDFNPQTFLILQRIEWIARLKSSIKTFIKDF